MDISTDTIVSNLIGGIVALVVSTIFYFLAGRQLGKETEQLRGEINRLRKMLNDLSFGVEDPDRRPFLRDDAGEVIGTPIRLRGSATGTSSATGPLSVDPPDSPT